MGEIWDILFGWWTVQDFFGFYTFKQIVPKDKYERFYAAPLNIKKQTPWPVVPKRNIPTERPPLVDEI
jgi:hypothetical protein